MVRRSISTTYYALFHFLADEAGLLLVGTDNKFRQRRRILARAFTHSGMKVALSKVRGVIVDLSVEEFFRPVGTRAGSVHPPQFARVVAAAFLDAQSKRNDADYNLNKELSTADAQLLAKKVEEAISAWNDASSMEDDFKHALCLLMLMKGQIKSEG